MAGASAEPAQSADARRYLDELEKTGICIVEGFWDPKTCADARAEVDRVIEQYPKFVNGNAKADMRVYGANNASALIAQFAEHPVLRNIATAYNCENTRTAFTLAAKLPASVGNQGSGEGWHRDAFLRQFKAILYLTDVSPDNGPFQLVKDSHRRWQVLRDIWAGRLRYMQYRISEPEVAHILKGDQGRLLTYTAKAGTLILVDTSSIHRGMPIKEGTRYALTNYYFPDGKIDSGLYEKFDVLQAGKAAYTG
jgi:ectoine hydroxylase-related dioxygenase (phytanoyl-CoA dioxygenase family)